MVPPVWRGGLGHTSQGAREQPSFIPALLPRRFWTGSIFTLGWLKEWACSRLFGLGTQLPWDEKWVIESLSDSTIYMAYYTIAHKLQGEQPRWQRRVASRYIGGSAQRRRFQFHFPARTGPYHDDSGSDARVASSRVRILVPHGPPRERKDLIGNHLTMALYNHAAIWKDRPDMWPRGTTPTVLST